jgi:hypothetical protein
MNRIGVTSPSMMRRIIDSTKKAETQSYGLDRESVRPESPGIAVRNTSDTTIPPYGMMQIKTNVNYAKDRVIDVEKPFRIAGFGSAALINGPFEIMASKFGAAQKGPVCLLKHDGATYPVGSRLGFKTDSFLATFGCMFSVIGPDALFTDLVRVISDFSILTGTVATTIPSNLSGTGNVTTTNPSVTYKAKTEGSSIAVGKKVLLLPCRGEWLATEIC